MVREAVAVAVECAQAASVVTDVEEEAIVTETEAGGNLVLFLPLRVCTVCD